MSIYVGHHERMDVSLMRTPRRHGERNNENEFLSTGKGLPWDVKPRRREAATAVGEGVGEVAAPRPRGSRNPRPNFHERACVDAYWKHLDEGRHFPLEQPTRRILSAIESTHRTRLEHEHRHTARAATPHQDQA